MKGIITVDASWLGAPPSEGEPDFRYPAPFRTAYEEWSTCEEWSTIVDAGDDAPVWLIGYDRGKTSVKFQARCKVAKRTDGLFVVTPLEPITDCIIFIETTPPVGYVNLTVLGKGICWLPYAGDGGEAVG